MKGDNMELAYLTERMREYNHSVTPGSECAAWQHYVVDCVAIHGILPWDADTNLDAGDMADYWIDVADGVSSDYVAETGDRRE